MKKICLVLCISLFVQDVCGMWGMTFNFFGDPTAEQNNDDTSDKQSDKFNKKLKESMRPEGSYAAGYAYDVREQGKKFVREILFGDSHENRSLEDFLVTVIQQGSKDAFQEMRKTCGTFINRSLYFDKNKVLERLEENAYTIREQKSICKKIEEAFIEKRTEICDSFISSLSLFNNHVNVQEDDDIVQDDSGISLAEPAAISKEVINEFKESLHVSSISNTVLFDFEENISSEKLQEVLNEELTDFISFLELLLDTTLLDEENDQEDLDIKIERLRQEIEAIKLGKEETLNGVINNIDRVFQDLASAIDIVLQENISDVDTKVNLLLDRAEKVISAIDSMKKETISQIKKTVLWVFVILALTYKIDIPFLFEKAELYGWVSVKKNADQTLEQ